jgi:hypothetical protein
MVPKQDKARATEFLCGLLEEAGEYRIMGRDQTQISFEGDPDVLELPFKAQIIIPNLYGTVDSFRQKVNMNAHNKIYTIPVLFKDGKTAFVRMVDTNKYWRKDKSLKRYTKQQINQMLHLRDIEKTIIGYIPAELKKLQYYQPKSERLEEAVREFRLDNVLLDYSHVTEDHRSRGFVENCYSIDYKFPLETLNITHNAGLDIANSRFYIGKFVQK